MTKIKRPVYSVEIDAFLEGKERTLIRTSDKKTVKGSIRFLEFHKDGHAKAIHDIPKIGYSCVVNAHFGTAYTWLTTVITKVISETEFNTKNSHYIIK